MLVHPVRHVEHQALDHDPQIVLAVVLLDLVHRELLVRHLELGHGLGLRHCARVRAVRLAAVEHRRGRRLLLLVDGRLRAAAAVGPLDGDPAGRRGIDVQRDLLQPLGRRRHAAADQVLEHVLAGRVAGDAAVDDAAEQRRATESVCTVHATGQLAARVQSVEGLLIRVEHLGSIVDLDPSHGEMQHGLHDGDVEGIVDREGHVVEELLTFRVLLLARSDIVVVGEGLVEGGLAAADLLDQLLARHLLHEAAAGVVPRVEVEHLRGLGVQDEPYRPVALLLLLPQLSGDIVAVAKFVGEALAFRVEENASFTA